jgi:uncharacterized protein YndB with AHSA1/START domain
MPAVRVTEFVEVSPERVWAAQLDAEGIPQWFPGARSVKAISGPLDQVGTTYAIRFNPLIRSRVTVTEVELPVMHTRMWDARPLGTHGRATVLIRPEEGGTRVDLDVDFELPLGPLGRMRERLSSVRHRNAREIRRELHAFCEFARQRR